MIYFFKLKLKVAMFPTLADFSTLPMNHLQEVGYLIYSFSEPVSWHWLSGQASFSLVLHHSHSEGLRAGKILTGKQEVALASFCVCQIKKSCRRTPQSTAHTSDSANLPQRGPSPIKPSGKSLRAQSMKNNHYFLLWCQPAQQRVPLTALKGIYSFPHLSHFILLT